MAKSKVTPEDAREWLASLQQVGEGWWRGVGLAVRMGAPQALGMDRREFAAQIGHRLIDPREAIIELHREGMSQRAIADILGVAHDQTVNRVLAEEGLVEMRPALAQRTSPDETAHLERSSIDSTANEVDEEKERLEQQIQDLEDQVAESKGEARRKTKALRDEVKQLNDQLRRTMREAEEREREAQSDQDKLRAYEEEQAQTEEMLAPVRRMRAQMAADGVKGLIEEATEMLGVVAEDPVKEEIQRIERALTAFNNELAFVKAKVGR